MPFRKLLDALFGKDDGDIGAAFPQMLDLASETFDAVHEALWSGGVSEELRVQVYKSDVRINQMQRAIRKDVFTHLVCGNTQDVTACFVLIHVVKDAERIGDYVKNLVDPIVDASDLPKGPLVEQIQEMGARTAKLLARVRPVFEGNEEAEAEKLLRQGRNNAAECDTLVKQIAAAGMESGPTTALVLITRFYKRLNAHATNILSAILMPVHKIDYFDEEALDREV